MFAVEVVSGVIGTKGNISPIWSYDAYYQYGRTSYTQVYSNEFSAARLARALNVVTDTRPGSATLGQPVCRAVIDGSDPNCVPYNVFGGAGAASAASVAYLSATGFQKGQFATIMCPAWMTSYIRTNAPDTSGKWNIARIPGTGGGNWGGSYLAVPKESKNVAAAVELAKWLTAPEQQTWLFKNKGNFPSAQALWAQADVANYKDAFFSNAPVGQIFSASQLALKPQPLGAHAGDIGNAFGNALLSIEQGKASPDEAWTKALADVKNLTS